MLSFNCLSVRNKVPTVLKHLKDNDIDICMLQETWLNKGDSSVMQEIKDHGYNIISQRRLRGDVGGGVAILFKPHIVVRKCKPVRYESFEYICCTVHTRDKTFRIVNIYRLQYSRKHPVTKKMFLNDFSELMEQIISLPGSLIVTGDFNYHVENVNHDKDVQDFVQMVDSFNLHQHVVGPTHRSGGTLDLVMTSVTDHNINSVKSNDDRLGSDHHPISFNVSCMPRQNDNFITLKCRQYRKLDVDKFKYDLGNGLASFGNLDPEQAANLYSNVTTSVLEKYCPLMTLRVRKRPSSHWYTDELQNIKRLKRKCERAKKKNPGEYKDITKRYNKAMAIARLEYYGRKIQESKSDKKSMYKVLNHVLGCQEDSVFPTNKDTKSVTNDLADYFSNKIQTIRNDISAKTSIIAKEDPVIVNDDVVPLTEFSTLTCEDIKSLILDMNSKSCQLDPMPTWLVKECIDVLSPILTHIVNTSLRNHIFPSSLKHATITPIIKDSDEDSEQYSNYRPISNTSFVAKLLEKSALQQINLHIEAQQLHAEVQSGYRKYHSCETATLKVVNDMKRDVAQGKVNALLLLDLSAAFDTVDHEILLQRVAKSYGLTSNTAKWLKSYLEHRTFSVHIGGEDSKIMNMLFGVPQGSLLGPVLFNLYTKDLVLIARKYNLSIHIYADDTQLYIGFENDDNTTNIKNNIDSCLSDINEWMLRNFLKLNPTKTKVIFIGSKRQLNQFGGMSISDIPLENYEHDVVKSLGVYIDSTLSMTHDINKKCSTCYYHLRNIGRIKRSLSQEQRILLVHALVFSSLDYCNSLFANVPGYSVKKLQRVINAAARMIYDVKKRDHITPYVKRAHFLPAKYRIRFKLCLLVYKGINGLAPSYLVDILVLRDSNLRGSRDFGLLQIPPKREKTIHYQMCVCWNSLPQTIRFSKNIDIFKTSLKTYFFDQAYASDEESDSEIDDDDDEY